MTIPPKEICTHKIPPVCNCDVCPVSNDPGTCEFKYLSSSHARSPEFLATLSSEGLSGAGERFCKANVIDCPQCAKYKKFIQAMIAEFDKYGANKTAQYYKGQCEKVINDILQGEKDE